MTSRIRCSCGRVYDPQKHTHCPECGAESAVESVVVSEKVKPPAAVDETTVTKTTGRESKAGDGQPGPSFAQLLKMVPWPVLAGGVVLVVFVLALLLRHHGGDGKQVARETERDKGSETSSPTPGPTGTASADSPSVSPTPWPSQAPVAGNLEDLIAGVGQNGIVKLKPGLYQGGVVVSRPLQIIGDSETPEQVVIQADGKDVLSVSSKNVFLKNVQVVSRGSGETSAIAVGENGELEAVGIKVTSGGASGVIINGNASLKATESTFMAAHGTAVQVESQGHAIFTKCNFTDAQTGLWLKTASVCELHSCAFERNGAHNGRGAIIALIGEKTSLTADDCRFTSNPAGLNLAETASLVVTNSSFKNNGVNSSQGNLSAGLIQVRSAATAKLEGDTFESNSQGINATNGGIVEIDKCRFTSNGLQTRGELVASCMAITGNGEGTTVTVRNSTISGPASYAVGITGSARMNLEETEISGARTVGLLVGDRNGLAATAEAKHCRFIRNTTGIGVSAGSAATISDSEVRENSEGALALDRGTHLVLTKTKVVGNREHGICVYGGAEAQATESQIENNARGAQSGMQKKAAMSAFLSLQDCRVAGNQTFGVGACAKSQLTLTGVTFEANKTNIYRESGAIIRTEGSGAGDQAQATATESPDQDGDDNQSSTKRSKKQKHADDARTILRRIFKPN
jgi:parallel beta helix pectate lyase-like protein